MMQMRTGSLLIFVALACGFVAARAHAAEVALLFSTYQEETFRYMPGEDQGQYTGAGARI